MNPQVSWDGLEFRTISIKIDPPRAGKVYITPLPTTSKTGKDRFTEYLFPYSFELNLTAIPDFISRFVFDHWSGDIEDSPSKSLNIDNFDKQMRLIGIKMNRDRKLIAHFVEKPKRSTGEAGILIEK